MYNWSVDESELRKEPDRYIPWKLEQMANFGLRGGRLNEANLRKYWSRLSLDPRRKKFLSFLLYGRDHTHEASAGVA